jgi:hypothetical protein
MVELKESDGVAIEALLAEKIDEDTWTHRLNILAALFKKSDKMQNNLLQTMLVVQGPNDIQGAVAYWFLRGMDAGVRLKELRELESMMGGSDPFGGLRL